MKKVILFCLFIFLIAQSYPYSDAATIYECYKNPCGKIVCTPSARRGLHIKSDAEFIFICGLIALWGCATCASVAIKIYERLQKEKPKEAKELATNFMELPEK